MYRTPGYKLAEDAIFYNDILLNKTIFSKYLFKYRRRSCYF